MGIGFGDYEWPTTEVDDGWPGMGEYPEDQTFADVLNGFIVRSSRRNGRYTADMVNADIDGDADRTTSGTDVVAPEMIQEIPPNLARAGGVIAIAGLNDTAADDLIDDLAMVRPYAWTKGRTRCTRALELQTLVSTSALGNTESLLTQVEYRAVAELCRHPHSVAEIAAKLSIPIGVARVILSDMTEQGLISVHHTLGDDDVAAHLGLMERVLGGLRRL